MIIANDNPVDETPMWQERLLEDRLIHARLTKEQCMNVRTKFSQNLDDDEFEKLIEYINQFIDLDFRSAGEINRRIKFKMNDDRS